MRLQYVISKLYIALHVYSRDFGTPVCDILFLHYGALEKCVQLASGYGGAIIILHKRI